MKFKRFTGSALGFLAVGGVAWGCSSQASDCKANENCGPYNGGAGASSGGGASGTSAGGSSGSSGASAASGSSGTSSGGEAGVGGESGAAGSGVAACDTTSSPTAESCLVSDDYGVFVAPNGDDNNSGSMDAPVATITQAISLAQAAGKFVVACDGTYDEQVSISASVTLYGGFTCPGSRAPWQAEAGGKAKVAPSVRGIALTLKSSTAPVSIADFEFDAQDGVNPGESSVAALLNGASNVTMTRVKIVAGRGVDGVGGTLTKVTLPAQTALNGVAAIGDTGGAFNQVICAAGGATKGGRGGDGGLGVFGGSPGTPEQTTGGTAGALGSACGATPSGTGGDGANAGPQAPAPGATKFGSIIPTGWTGASGSDGTPGTPGQGGGGGTGAASGGGGGGGGAGGCGGAGGTAGKAGGSSIALALLDSSIILSASELVAVAAGKGGDGAAGQAGQAGGSGGVQVPDGCAGGKGGTGGTGGAGGGGAGGVSVGIAYQGSSSPPAPDAETRITVGKAGDKGLCGISGTTNGDGIAGQAQAILGVP
jgi:Protein of unknown function (DUF1565)